MYSLILYSELFRKVFESDLEDHGALADIYRLLCVLRQALTCSVCGNVLVVPMTSSTSKCRHAVCEGCMGQTMRLSAPCTDCNSSTSGFTENKQLRIVLQFYKNICLYLCMPRFQRKWGSLNGGTNVTFRDIVVEGSRLTDNYRRVEPSSTSLPSTSSSVVPSLAASSLFSPFLSSPCVAAAPTTLPAQTTRVLNRTSAIAAATVTKSVSGDRARPAVLLNGDAMALAHDRATSAPYKLINLPAESHQEILSARTIPDRTDLLLTQPAERDKRNLRSGLHKPQHDDGYPIRQLGRWWLDKERSFLRLL
ncbi:hypothetical protein MRX96_001082 [Rhipicephalus microplus]